MRQILQLQLDYILFIFALEFFLLFFVCLLLQRKYKLNIPWYFMGLFGLVHGISQWLDMSALSLGDSTTFRWVRLVIMDLSFIFLFEFGRLSCERIGYMKIGRWIYLPILMTLAFNLSSGISYSQEASYLSLGLLGGMWSAAALWRISLQNRSGSFHLRLAAGALLSYCLLCGAVPITSLLKTYGLQVQILGSLLAGAIFRSIWYYYQNLYLTDVDGQMSQHLKKITRMAVLIFLLIIFSGWVATNIVGQDKINDQKKNMLDFSKHITEIVDTSLVKALSASEGDLSNQAYLILKNRFEHTKASFSYIRFIYLMRQVDNKIVFLLDSEPEGSKDMSPPGQVYEEATPKLKNVFVSGTPTLDDVMDDRWGSWISAYYPVNDPKNGSLIAVLGVDQNSLEFDRSVARERFQVIVLVGLICLFILLTFVYWQRFTIALFEINYNDRIDVIVNWGIAGIIMMLGATLTLTLFLNLKHQAWSSFEKIFLQHAMNRAQSVSQELDRQLERLDGLSRLFNSQKSVDRDEFSQYVRELLIDAPVRALEWIPQVRKEKRLEYEENARGQGLSNFEIYEKDSKGNKIPAAERDSYFPVYYLEPLRGNEAALGFDLASESIRNKTMQRSCETGQPSATQPLILVQDDQKRLGVLLFMPVYENGSLQGSVDNRRKNLKGYVLAVYNTKEFLKSVYSKMPSEGLTAIIQDLDYDQEGGILFRYVLSEGSANWENPIIRYEMPLEMPGRRWRQTIIPGSRFIEENLSQSYWFVLPIGLFITTLVASFLNFLATARYRAEKLVQLRTAELNRDKEALREREENFQLILNSTAEAIYGVDLRGNCTFCNPASVRMLGYASPQDLLGKNMHELIHHSYPDGRHFPVEQCELFFSFKENRQVHLETAFWRQDKTPFFVEAWSYPEIKNGKTVGAVVSFLDITERKIAEEALRKREAYLSSILDNFPYLVWLKDVNGLFLAVNKVFANACGKNVEEIVGRTDFDIWPKDLAQKYVDDDKKVMSERKKVVVEEPIASAGETRYFETYKSPIFDAGGHIIGTTGFSHDVTERKKAEQSLRESEERYRTITSSVTDYIYRVQVADGKPVSTIYGPGCQLVTGYKPEEFITRPTLWIEIVPVEDRPIVEKQIQDIFNHDSAEPIEHRIQRKDGTVCWVSNTIVPQYNESGQLVAYDGLIADITQRKKAEEVLLQAKETAEKALSMKDEFTSTVSHELRTPLAAIKSSIDILDTEVPGQLTEDQKVFIKRVKSNIDRLARLINDVLDLSKLESGRMSMNLMPLRIESIIQEVVESQMAVVKSKGLKIEMEFGKDLYLLVADKDRLVQVFNNLINNALKFTKEGKITISAIMEDEKTMKFSVTDTGMGIKQEDIDKLFKKFQQVGGASQQVGGTGLGLAICKQIIDRHYGRIWVESQFGKGSTFCFTIPVRKSKRLLLVDDDPATLEVLRNILEGEEQYEIELASDGFLAGQKYSDFSPQVIILDIKIPKINGLEVCLRIKNDPKTKHTKIIMLSSFTSNEQIQKAWDAGADEILNKPINSEELIAKVRKLFS